MATLAIATVGSRGALRSDEPFALLQQHLGFGAADLRDLTRARSIRRTLDTSDARELATAGAIRIDVPRTYFLDRFRDITEFRRGPMVLQTRRIEDPPGLDDVQALTLDDEDLNALRRCRPGDCAVKLSADMIRRFQVEVRWSAPESRMQANALARQMVVDQARAYLAGGVEALGAYHSRRKPVVLATELTELLNACPYLTVYAPELRSFLDAFPRIDLQSCENFLYWSKDSFGLKPIISLTHVAMFTTQRDGRAMTFIVSINLYSSHYVDGSVSLTIAADAGGEDEPAFYLIYVNRSRVDALGGVFGGLRRLIVERRARGGLEKNLPETKRRLEAGYRLAVRSPASSTAGGPPEQVAPSGAGSLTGAATGRRRWCPIAAPRAP